MVTAMSEGGKKIKNRICMILNQPNSLVISFLAVTVSIMLGLISFINISFANNFTSDELFTIKNGKVSATKIISLGNIYDVYNLINSLPNPNDNYQVNLITINNEASYNKQKCLDIIYELSDFFKDKDLSNNKMQKMDKNALQLFNNIYDIEAVTFTYIDKIANSREKIKKHLLPIAIKEVK